jgi:hypothetical protein
MEADVAEYEVRVPFQSELHKTLSSETEYALPSRFEAGAISVEYDEKEGFYVATLRVAASNSDEAMAEGVVRLRTLLSLLAVSGDAFTPVLGRKVTASKIRGVEDPQEQNTIITEDPETGHRHIRTRVTAEITGRTFASLKKIRDSLEFEQNALKSRDSWPEWLPVALELNYLATTADNPKVSLLLRYAALDLIVRKHSGAQGQLLDEALGPQKTREFSDRVKSLASEYGLAEPGIERLVHQVVQTHAESMTNCIKQLLHHHSIKATSKEIRLAGQVRGKIAHLGSMTSESDLANANKLVRQWVQTLLKSLLAE